MDNKKYYYLKLKENYFDKDNMKILESMENGHTYSLIILKLYLKSCKSNGKLMMTERIPYDPKKTNILASVINHDVAHVKEAIKLGCELDLIAIMDSGDIWMTEIQNYIGHSSNEADRKREYRKQFMDKCPTNDLVPSDKTTPELKIELKIKKEHIDLAKFLYTEHLKHDDKYLHGKHKKLVFTKWADDIRKLNEIDGRDIVDIKNIIEWVKSDGNFWIANIMSGKKLREKYSVLFQQYKKENPQQEKPKTYEMSEAERRLHEKDNR